MTKKPRQTIQQIFDSHLQVLATVLRPSTLNVYKGRLKLFLSYLEAAHPEVCRLSQLRRDPHILGWLRKLHEHQPPLSNSTWLGTIITVRRLLNDLAASNYHRLREGLLVLEDCPPRDRYLPKPLSPEDDRKLEQQLRKNDNLCSNGLLLLRGTGMRIGECLSLPVDSLRDFGRNQWAIRIPLGKLHNERWVPVDEDTCRIFRRILSVRSSAARTQTGAKSGILLLQKTGRVSYNDMRKELTAAARQAGCSICPTPHQLRHTYATTMLRAGASLLAVKELLGHRSIEMTMGYVEVSQVDLQREYHRARQKMGEFPAIPKITQSIENPGIPTLCQSLIKAHHLMEMFRRQLDDEQLRRKLARLNNRLVKISSELSQLDKAKK